MQINCFCQKSCRGLQSAFWSRRCSDLQSAVGNPRILLRQTGAVCAVCRRRQFVRILHKVAMTLHPTISLYATTPHSSNRLCRRVNSTCLIQGGTFTVTGTKKKEEKRRRRKKITMKERKNCSLPGSNRGLSVRQRKPLPPCHKH